MASRSATAFLGLANTLAGRRFDNTVTRLRSAIYSADCRIWARMLLNSFSTAARASINSGELSWQSTVLGRETPQSGSSGK
jgi:hypothetical protein